MFHRRNCLVMSLVLVAAVIVVGFPQLGSASPCKVLAVMSYEENFPWVQEIREGVDSTFAGKCEVTYFYMDTKVNPDGGPQKAEEAYALYQELQPDGVITSDDNAQSMFVVPYLSEKVETPVMFCGVNAPPETYGFPSSNVSGILERAHIKESLALIQQLVPEVKKAGFFLRDNPTGQGVVSQVEAEIPGYPVESVGIKLSKTLQGAIQIAEEFKAEADVLFLSNLEGLVDDAGAALTEKEIIPQLVEAFGKPTIADDAYRVSFGALAAVVKTGQEQGTTAAEMLLKAIEGTPVSEIPITQNKFGRRVINIDTMKSLGIKPSPAMIRGAELVKTEQ